MRTLCALTALVLYASFARAQANQLNLDDLVSSAEQWANENLDDEALKVIQTVDREKVKDFFTAIQKEFKGGYVLDLAALKDTAKSLVPVLEKYEESVPYSLWLK